jgi:hypothetical protein
MFFAGIISLCSTHLLEKGRIRSRIRTFDLWIRIQIREAQKLADPAYPDPDPQHCL